MIFQRTVQNKGFPKSKKNPRICHTRPAEINARTQSNGIYMDLAKKYSLLQQKPFRYSMRSPKPSTAPYRTYRCVSLSREPQNVEQELVKEKQQERQLHKQLSVGTQYPQFRASLSHRNQLLFLQPHRKYMDKSVSLNKVKSHLYKKIANISTPLTDQIQQGRIIQYLTEYEDKQRSHVSLENKPITRYTSGKAFDTSYLMSQSPKEKQNLYRKDTKNPSIAVLWEKIKNRQKESKYTKRIKNIKAQHKRKGLLQQSDQ